MSTEKGKLKQCDVMDKSYCVEVQIITSPKLARVYGRRNTPLVLTVSRFLVYHL